MAGQFAHVDANSINQEQGKCTEENNDMKLFEFVNTYSIKHENVDIKSDGVSFDSTCIEQSTHNCKEQDEEMEGRDEIVQCDLISEQEIDCLRETMESVEGQEIHDLAKLLSDWNLEHLLEKLVEQKVFVNVLMVMRPHHIERLLRNYDFGTQILFEHKLDEWRQSLGKPLVYCAYSSVISPPTPTPAPSITKVQIPSRKPHFAPYTTPQNNQANPRIRTDMTDNSDITLANILNESPKGCLLVDYYNKFLKFQDDQRTSLINLIAQYFEDKGQPITLSTSYRMEREILDRFPTEKLEYYRASKRGRIYNKFCNLKMSFKTAVGKHVVNEKPAKKEEHTYRPVKHYEPEDEAESCFTALKFGNLSEEQFDDVWKACSHFRLNDLKNLGNTEAILEKWYFYKNPLGYRLIDMDFAVSVGNSDGLLKNWDRISEKMLEFLCNENNVKDRNIRGLLEHLRKNILSENSRRAALFWALHGYFVPTNKTVKRDDDGKNKTTKYTIKDSQDSFLFVGKCAQEVEDHITNLLMKKSNIEPFIYCIGEDITAIEETYVFFNNIRYRFLNLLKAVDICFKIFYVFDLSFPTESGMFYSFLETFFFKLKSQKGFPKVFMLTEYLESE